MKYIDRYIDQPITEDLNRKMVFVGGPSVSLLNPQ